MWLLVGWCHFLCGGFIFKAKIVLLSMFCIMFAYSNLFQDRFFFPWLDKVSTLVSLEDPDNSYWWFQSMEPLTPVF